MNWLATQTYTNIHPDTHTQNPVIIKQHAGGTVGNLYGSKV